MEYSMIEPHSQLPHMLVQSYLGVIVGSATGEVVGGRSPQRVLRTQTRTVQAPLVELYLG